ncbi:MAG: lipid-A-disaccharide synthase, partial [Bacteroidetes bacterium HGW-Bacteroidetes-22]
MRYYLIAGEASGDLHAARLIVELKKLDPEATFRGWGGDLMKEAGMDLVKHYRDLAFMGFSEVIVHLPTIFRNIRLAKEELSNFRPDVLILVDYPGFNLRISKFARNNNIRVFYYISPQIWAWKQGRVQQIKQNVDRMYVILPFEKEFYARFGVEVDFPGHPLPESIAVYQPSAETDFRTTNNLDSRPIVAILPGSRKQEIKKVLPLMLRMRQHFPDYQFVI